MIKIIKLNQLNDCQLIATYLNGNSMAGEILTNRYYKKIEKLCLRYLKNNQDAGDLTHEILVKIFLEKKIVQFKGGSSLWTWLYRVVINSCLQYMAKRKKYMHLEDLVQVEHFHKLESRTKDPLEKIIHDQNKILVKQQLEKLPYKYRRVLECIFWNDYSHAKTAADMDISSRHVAVLAIRAKRKVGQNKICFE